MPGKKYGWKHQQVRERVKRQVDAGLAVCARCGLPIIPGTSWDLGHIDGSPGAYQGPEHRHCNRRSAAHKAAAKRQARAPEPGRSEYPATPWMRKSMLDGSWQPCSRQWHSDVVANPDYQGDDVGPAAA